MSLSSFVARLADQIPVTSDGRVIVIVAIVGAVGTPSPVTPPAPSAPTLPEEPMFINATGLGLYLVGLDGKGDGKGDEAAVVKP